VIIAKNITTEPLPKILITPATYQRIIGDAMEFIANLHSVGARLSSSLLGFAQVRTLNNGQNTVYPSIIKLRKSSHPTDIFNAFPDGKKEFLSKRELLYIDELSSTLFFQIKPEAQNSCVISDFW
jgi:hypothetical protein